MKLIGFYLLHLVAAIPRLSSYFNRQNPLEKHTKLESNNESSGQALGAVASESEICTTIGTDLLSKGGSAADAVVGTTLCVGVVGMYHSGIGGGGFMIVRASNRTMYDIDFREAAPSASNDTMYHKNATASIVGGLSVGVPGELRGLQWLHDHFGKLPWKDVVMPAAEVARNGWIVGEDLVRYMGFVGRYSDFLTKDPNWALDFAPTGTLVGLGDRIKRKRYGATLEIIAEHGVETFYSGPMAKSIVDTVNKTGGILKLQDMVEYDVVIREPLSITYRDFQLTSCGAPASGALALGILKIVEGYKDFGWNTTENLSTHRLNEAFRFGYAQRAKLGDPPYVSGMDEYQANMLNASYQAITRSKISDSSTHNASYYNPENLQIQTSDGTAQISAADSKGLAISITSTINLLFGSRVMDPTTGIILNDEMNDFSIPNTRNAFNYTPFINNFVVGNKRPLSSITPVIVEHLSNGSLYFITGAAGGSRIPTATIQSLWHVLDRNASVYEALAVPRLHDQLQPNFTDLQYGYNSEVSEFLAERGHIIRWVEKGMSAVHAIKVLEDGYEAVGEPNQKNSLGKVAYRQ